jgi:hypothetical protein
MEATDATLIAVVSGVVIPLLVGVITKLQASPAVKAVVHAMLAALAGALATIVPDVPWDWEEFIVDWATAWVVGVATYFGLWKPTAVAQRVQEATARFGIGRAA